VAALENQKARSQKAESFELVVDRTYNAPRDLVWKVFTDPAHARHWMGPRHHPAVAFEQDVRVGGRWSLTLKSVEDGKLLKQGGVFREIAPRERVVYTMSWDEAHPANGPEMLISIDFSDAGADKTRVVFRQEGLPSIPERDGHNEGWNSAFDRIDDLLLVAKAPERQIQWLYPKDDPVILGSRLFDAPRELVWECFTKGEHMAKWFGPAAYKTIVHEYDARVGGKWRLSHLDTAENKTYNFFGEFLELTPPEIFVWTFGFDCFPPGEETYTFVDLGGKTLLLTLSRFADLQSRDALKVSGMEDGAEQSYDRLAALLKTL